MKLENKLKTSIYGLWSGFNSGADPLGMIYSAYTGKKTVGGVALVGVGNDDTGKYNKPEGVDYYSERFKIMQTTGMVAGLAANVATHGLIQALELGLNYLVPKLCKNSKDEMIFQKYLPIDRRDEK